VSTPELTPRDLYNAIEEALRERGRVNVLIAGKSGVGKSTLVNAVFDKQLATTGQGRPVTTETREISKEGIPVHIFDTRGLELGAYQHIADELNAFIRERNASADPQQHIHVGWVCVAEDSRRLEEGESAFIEMLAGHMPVVLVVTKARSDNGLRAELQRLAPQVRNVVRVRAIAEQIEDFNLPVMGLNDLVELTMELVPEAQRNAFAAAQVIDLNQRVARSRQLVRLAALSAGTVGASPVPFSDWIAIMPIQVGMLAKISATFGIDVDANMLYTLITGTAGGALAAVVGKAAFVQLIKLIPGAGVVAGGLMAGGVALAVTSALGEAYIAALVALKQRDPAGQPTSEQLRDAFVEQLQQQPALRVEAEA
jgi:uncharacterized protein (DUF697 family)/GTP-binding protein EngB required for normal cell division